MLSARICIRPVLSPFLYFPYAGLTYPILLDSRISLVALPQLISFLVSLYYGSYDPFVPPSATSQRHHTILLDSRISLVALLQLISFSVLAGYSSVNPCVPPLLTRQRHHTGLLT